MNKILTFLIAVLVTATITSCKKSADTEPSFELKGTEWLEIKDQTSIQLRFINDSTCGIMTGFTDGRVGANYSEYTYRRGYGVDLMLFNQSKVEFTVTVVDRNTLNLYQTVDNMSVQDPFVLRRVK